MCVVTEGGSVETGGGRKRGRQEGGRDLLSGRIEEGEGENSFGVREKEGVKVKGGGEDGGEGKREWKADGTLPC